MSTTALVTSTFAPTDTWETSFADVWVTDEQVEVQLGATTPTNDLDIRIFGEIADVHLVKYSQSLRSPTPLNLFKGDSHSLRRDRLKPGPSWVPWTRVLQLIRRHSKPIHPFCLSRKITDNFASPCTVEKLFKDSALFAAILAWFIHINPSHIDNAVSDKPLATAVESHATVPRSAFPSTFDSNHLRAPLQSRPALCQSGNDDASGRPERPDFGVLAVHPCHKHCGKSPSAERTDINPNEQVLRTPERQPLKKSRILYSEATYRSGASQDIGQC
ncbi:hypothetical protein BD410DRAFT_843520 [Rickenella mellea]|uniref:Uncharacterized protein n=1 Tax=Rickenella mellea TaxID=50990 RepID=A0A4Y7PQ83_9AGAM|nr:hypothetical protein BD410DRAFT_843520 [Rickenella mellea]